MHGDPSMPVIFSHAGRLIIPSFPFHGGWRKKSSHPENAI